MNWKELFKPNIWNIILALFFFILSYVLINYTIAIPCVAPLSTCTYTYDLPQYRCGICSDKLTQWDYFYGSVLNVLIPAAHVLYPITYPGFLILIDFQNLTSSANSGMQLGGYAWYKYVPTILLDYVISCIIVYAVRKLKNPIKVSVDLAPASATRQTKV